MPDDSDRTTIEVQLPRALIERVRALEIGPERTAESLARESLEAYFTAYPAALETHERR